MSPFRRWLVKWARTVHLYTTLFALALILFFASTGFMLNHEDWFSPAEPYRTERKGTIAPVVEAARQARRRGSAAEDFGAIGAMETFEDEEDRVRVVFKRPGTQVTAEVMKEDGATEVTHDTRGFAGVVLDLHRGKTTGTAWSLVIDAVCVVLFAIAATGLVMWGTLRGRGRYGLAVVALGIVTGFAIYFAFVP